MLSKTEGIVLQTLKYSDSGIISHILTRDYGLLAFIVKGVHNKKSQTKMAYFQPLQMLNLEIYYKTNRNLQSVKEASTKVAFFKIPCDFARNSMAFFVGEVLRKTLNENEPNNQLYDFVYNNILFLDRAENINNFHLGFLVGLSRLLGIAPSKGKLSETAFFDMQNGVYLDTPPLHGFYMDQNFSRLLMQFSNSSIAECNDIPLTGTMRSSFLDLLLTYFSMHLPGLRKIKSLEVLAEVFGQ